MPSLKELKIRIDSVKSTQKITSAMKMVAASKLRRAQEQAEAGRPYAEHMSRMLSSLSAAAQSGGPKLIAGTGSDQVHLLVVMTSDRGLCGGFNANIARETRRQIRKLQGEGKTVKLICVGRKGRDNLNRDYPDLIETSFVDIGKPALTFDDANQIATQLLTMFEAGEADVVSVIYNRFESAISQVVTTHQLAPLVVDEDDPQEGEAPQDETGGAVYEFEPSEEQILAVLLPRNMAVQVYKSLLESAASEQGARMTAMDNATRNAGDMISRLTLEYNRSRQAAITKELIEIISGAEAV